MTKDRSTGATSIRKNGSYWYEPISIRSSEVSVVVIFK